MPRVTGDRSTSQAHSHKLRVGLVWSNGSESRIVCVVSGARINIGPTSDRREHKLPNKPSLVGVPTGLIVELRGIGDVTEEICCHPD